MLLQGIYITYVEEDSPADKAGLKQHDKILQVVQNFEGGNR